VRSRVSKLLNFSLKWRWQYIYYPLEFIYERKSLAGEMQPFRELQMLRYNKVSSGPLLPRIGDVVRTPELGTLGGTRESKVAFVQFDLPLEEITRDKAYLVYLELESDSTEYLQEIISKKLYGGWTLVSISDLDPGSYWFSILPGAKWFKPDFLDPSIKDMDFHHLQYMSKSEIRRNRSSLLYLRHHFLEADRFLESL